MYGIKNIKHFFQLLGFRKEDLVCFGASGHDLPFSRRLATVKEICDECKLEDAQNYNLYYSISSFKTNTNSKESNVRKVFEFVLDVDYGEHHRRKQFQNYDSALEYIKGALPPATIVVHTGGGFHLHYKLKKPIVSAADKKKYKALALTITRHRNVDCCCSLEHLFRLPFSNNIKAGAEIRKVSILEVHPEIAYSLDDIQKTFLGIDCTLDEPTEKDFQKHSIAIQRKTVLDSYDRSAAAFRLYMSLMNQFPTISDKVLETAVASDPVLFDHYHSDRHAVRRDIQRARAKFAEDSLESVLSVEKINVQGHDLSKFEGVRTLFDASVFSSRLPKIDATLSIIDKCYMERRKAILSLPCSSGKTFSALIFAAAQSSPECRFWLVSEKIESCKRNADILSRLGANVASLHGRDAAICEVPEKTFFHGNKREFCAECEHQCGAEIKYCAEEYRWDLPDADIVCCTHKHYKNALIAGELPQNLRMVIIDEAPELLEQFSFNDGDLNKIYSLLADNPLLMEFRQDMENIKALLADHSCRKIPSVRLVQSEIDEVIRFLFMQFQRRRISVEDFDFCLEFFQFFKNNNIFGMHEGDSYNFMAGEVNINSPVQTIILDGSAKLQSIKWNDFTILECDQLKQSYPNTTIHCILQNPTQSNLADRGNFEAILNATDHHVQTNSTALLFTNKNWQDNQNLYGNISRLLRLIHQKGCSLITLSRGEHIGSNSGREADISIIAMSLFSKISTYVLRTAIVLDEEIEKDRIWNVRTTQGKTTIIPRFSRDGSFFDKKINTEYLKSLERDLYQAILRGCIRDDSSAEYKVIALVSIPQLINLLKMDLPDAIINFVDNEILNLYFQGYSETKISQMTGIPRGTVRDQISKISLDNDVSA